MYLLCVVSITIICSASEMLHVHSDFNIYGYKKLRFCQEKEKYELCQVLAI